MRWPARELIKVTGIWVCIITLPQCVPLTLEPAERSTYLLPPGASKRVNQLKEKDLVTHRLLWLTDAGQTLSRPLCYSTR